MICLALIFGCITGLTSACNFGNGCTFPCNCRPSTFCHPITGCFDGCKQGYAGPGCLTQANIALGKETDQSNTEYSNNESYKAVDGVKIVNNLQYCSIIRGQQFLWWRVNFGNLYRVSTITLYVVPTWNYGSHISIYATESDKTSDLNSHVQCLTSVRLYPDRTGAVVVKPPTFCVGTSLIITGNDALTNPPLVLCEVEVQGHLYSDCDNGCGKHYDDYTMSCNAEYGCIADCNAGKSQESFCKDDCKPGTYGVNCKSRCGHCKNDDSCDLVNGSCLRGCQDWYIPDYCWKYIEEAHLRSNNLHLTATNSTVHVMWDPIRYEDPELRQHYGYNITYSQTSGVEEAILVRNTRVHAHQQVTLTGLQYNTYYRITVYPFRYQYTKVDMKSRSETKTIKTACIAPGIPEIVNYTITHNWNGTMEIGRLYIKVPSQSGCDRISRLIVSGIEETKMTGGVVRIVTLTLYAASRYHVTVTAENNEGLRTTSNPFLITVNGSAESIHIQNNVGLSVGIVVLFVVLAAGTIAILLLVRRRKKRENAYKDDRNHVHYSTDSQSKQPMLQINVDTNTSCNSLDLMEGVDPDVQDVVYENTRLVENKIKLSDLGMYIKKNGLAAEFDSLPKGHLAMCEAASLECNINKNRYRNVKPYDHTRVILTGNKDGDYINANYITGYGNKCKRYIATQGPKSNTVADFWHMIWQENVYVIVMLTPVVENLKKQSELYWPVEVDDAVSFGDFRVVLTSEDTTAYYVYRTLKISKQTRLRNVHHFQFLAWPDKNRPDHNYSILDFTQRVKHAANNKSPLLVHCSAGIGRTGTYIALDYLLEQADAEHLVDIATCVHLIRTQRTSLVQTLPQYKFLYEALYHHYMFGHTTMPLREFNQKVKDINRSSSLPAWLWKQFQALDLTRPKRIEDSDGKKPENRNKNRDMNIIPGDDCRPYIMTLTDSGNNYINAVTVDMHQKRDAVIVTQVPLPNTTNDFWSLVLDHDCDLIVLLDDPDSYDDPNCSRYWPDVGCSHTYGKVEVSVVSEKPLCTNTTLWTVTIRKMSRLQRNSAPCSLTFIQYSGWPPELRHWDVEKCGEFLDMMSHVEAIRHRAGAKTIVQCLYGSSRSGVYCATRIVLDRITRYQEVDVAMASQMVVSRRSAFLQTEDDYLILHRLVDKYTRGFETYVNLPL